MALSPALDILAVSAALLSEFGMEFAPSKHLLIRFSGRRLRFRFYRLGSVEESTPDLPFEPRQAGFETRPITAVNVRCDGAEPMRAPQLRKRRPHKRSRTTYFPRAAFIVDRKLFVGLESFARTAEHRGPKLARERQISVAFRQPRQRFPGRAARFFRQFRRDRLRVKLSRARCLSAPFANPRNSEKLERVLAARFRVGEQRKCMRGQS